MLSIIYCAFRSKGLSVISMLMPFAHQLEYVHVYVALRSCYKLLLHTVLYASVYLNATYVGPIMCISR
jgi:hypothetical protein